MSSKFFSETLYLAFIFFQTDLNIFQTGTPEINSLLSLLQITPSSASRDTTQTLKYLPPKPSSSNIRPKTMLIQKIITTRPRYGSHTSTHCLLNSLPPVFILCTKQPPNCCGAYHHPILFGGRKTGTAKMMNSSYIALKMIVKKKNNKVFSRVNAQIPLLVIAYRCIGIER